MGKPTYLCHDVKHLLVWSGLKILLLLHGQPMKSDLCDSCSSYSHQHPIFHLFSLWKRYQCWYVFSFNLHSDLSPVLNWCLLLRCACHGVNNLIPNDKSTLWVQGGSENREQNRTHHKKRGVKQLFNHYELRKNNQTTFFSTAWVFSSLKQGRK